VGTAEETGRFEAFEAITPVGDGLVASGTAARVVHARRMVSRLMGGSLLPFV
jgi:hypothetical protein